MILRFLAKHHPDGQGDLSIDEAADVIVETARLLDVGATTLDHLIWLHVRLIVADLAQPTLRHDDSQEPVG